MIASLMATLLCPKQWHHFFLYSLVSHYSRIGALWAGEPTIWSRLSNLGELIMTMDQISISRYSIVSILKRIGVYLAISL